MALNHSLAYPQEENKASVMQEIDVLAPMALHPIQDQKNGGTHPHNHKW
jgi:hypothetical protein